MKILGIDVGGSGIKGAPVDIGTGKLLDERLRIKTPQKAEPQPVADVVAEIAKSFRWSGPIGIGTAIFHRGRLLPNTEFGHLEMNGREAEHRASDAARKREDLSWKKYAKRLNNYLTEMERLFWPNLFIIGGGISKKSEKYIPPARDRNAGGARPVF